MCEVCEEILYDKANNEYYLKIKGSWDSYHDDYEYVELLINYCPECGKKCSK